MKIAIASGKGGTGKTTVATNLFETLRLEGSFAVDFVDTNVGEPNAHLFLERNYIETPQKEIVELRIPVFDTEKCTFCGKCVQYCEYDAILMVKESKHISLVDNQCKSCGACIYACHDNAITEVNKDIGKIRIFEDSNSRFLDGNLNVGFPFVTPIIQPLKNKIIKERISIIDTSPGTSRSVVEAIYDADFIVLVSESSAFGLHDLKLMVKMLNELRKDFGVVINRYHGEHTIVQEYLEKSKIPLLMEIPFKKEYAKLFSQSKLLIQQDDSEANDEMKKKFMELFESVKTVYLQKSLYR